MAGGNFFVNVECEGGKEFQARVTGYDENRMEVSVEFVSDVLSIKKFVRVVTPRGFGGMGPEDDDRYDLVEKDVPIKQFTTVFTNIKL